jgi:hypothetical protein
MTTPGSPPRAVKPGLFRRYRNYVLVPMAVVVILWLLLVLLTENQNIAPFIYATN